MGGNLPTCFFPPVEPSCDLNLGIACPGGAPLRQQLMREEEKGTFFFLKTSKDGYRLSRPGLFWLAGAQELEDRGRELRLGERGDVVRALDDLDVATAE